MTFLVLTHSVRDIAITLWLSLQIAFATCKPCVMMRRRPARLASLGFTLTLTASALQHSRPARLALALTLLTRSASALHHSQRPKVLLVDCHDSYTHNVAS